MWTRACDLLTDAGYKVTFRNEPGGRYDVEGLAKNVGIREVNELAVKMRLATRPKQTLVDRLFGPAWVS